MSADIRAHHPMFSLEDNLHHSKGQCGREHLSTCHGRHSVSGKDPSNLGWSADTDAWKWRVGKRNQCSHLEQSSMCFY